MKNVPPNWIRGLFLQFFDIGHQIVKAAVEIGFGIHALSIDEAVGQQEHLNAQLGGGGVVGWVSRFW